MTSVGPQQFAGPLSGHYFCPSSPHVCFSWICPQLDKPASRPKSKKLRAPNDPTVLPLSVCYIHSGYIFLRTWSGLAPVYSGKCTSRLCGPCPPAHCDITTLFETSCSSAYTTYTYTCGMRKLEARAQTLKMYFSWK